LDRWYLPYPHRGYSGRGGWAGDLRGGLGSGLGGGDAGGFRLLFGCHGPNSQIFLCLFGQLGLSSSDDQDLLKLEEVRSRAKRDECVGLVVRVGCDGLNGAYLQTARKDLIAA
jgi:hypothetical protein